MHLQKKSWCTTVEVQAALQKPSPEWEWSSQPGKHRGGTHGGSEGGQPYRNKRVVPARSQKGAGVFAHPVTRNLAFGRQGESLLPAQEKQALCFPRGLAGERTLCCQCPPELSADHISPCHTGQGPQGTGTAMSSSTSKDYKVFHLSAKS